MIEKDNFGRFYYKLDVLKGNKIEGRMVLRKQPLLQWVNLISFGKGILPGYCQLDILNALP